MKSPTQKLTAIAAVVLTCFDWHSASAQMTNSPIILCHPMAQIVQQNKKQTRKGAKATFTVQAKIPGPPYIQQPLLYQWQKRGPGQFEFVTIQGATNDTFTIGYVTTNDVAYYRVNVTSGYDTNATTITSEPAHLLVFIRQSPIVVYGSPVPTGGNSSPNPCPGAYAGSVTYENGGYWGWAGDHGYSIIHHTAKDDTGTDTIIQGYPYGGGSPPCGTQPIEVTHNSSEATKYQFSIYFPVGTAVSTNPYPLRLNQWKNP